jgi:hypothetical protein
MIFKKGKRIEARKKYLNLEAPLDYINLHVRGGFVMPTRDPKDCRNIDCMLALCSKNIFHSILTFIFHFLEIERIIHSAC